MTEFVDALKQHVSANLWLVISVMWGITFIRDKYRDSQEADEKRIAKEIHTGLTAWVNNGGGQQIRLIVRDELHEALTLHADRCPALKQIE